MVHAEARSLGKLNAEEQEPDSRSLLLTGSNTRLSSTSDLSGNTQDEMSPRSGAEWQKPDSRSLLHTGSITRTSSAPDVSVNTQDQKSPRGAEWQKPDSQSLLPTGSNTRPSSAPDVSVNTHDKMSPRAALNTREWILGSCCAILVVIVATLAIAIAVLASGKGSARCQEPCPKHWTYTEGTCYYISTEETDWESSRNFCRSQGASLLVMKSHEDLLFTQNQVCGKDFWIGLMYIEGALTWVDGSPYDHSLFHINDLGECAFIDKNGISMSGCHLPQRWICRMEPDW